MSSTELTIRNRYRAIYALDELPGSRVLRCRDEQNDQLVLIAELAAADDDARIQLQHLATQIASIEHDMLLPLREHFAERNFYYLVCDNPPGQELERAIRTRGSALPEADVLAQATRLLNLLDFLHQQRPPLLLGDPHPSDIWVRDDGTWIVAPFTLARPISTNLSAYRAPELEHADVEPSTVSDIYAVSALLYLACTGWAPAPASQQSDAAPLVGPRSLNPALSTLVEQALLRGLQLRAANRYQVAREMRVALETLRLMGGHSLGHQAEPAIPSGRPTPTMAPMPVPAPVAPVPVSQEPAPTPAIPAAVVAPPPAAERRGMSTGCIVATTVLVMMVALLACLVVAFLFTPLRQLVGLGSRAPQATIGPTLAPLSGATDATAGPTVAVPTQLPIALGADAITLQNAATITQTDVITTSHFGPVEYDPTDKLIAVAIDDQINLRNASTLDEVGQLVGHTSPVFALAWSPDGTLLASSGAGENDVLLWDVATRTVRATLRGHTGWVRSVAFSPDGTLVAAGSVDNTILIWEVASADERATLSGHTDWVANIAFSPDGTSLASTSRDGSVRLWDVATATQHNDFAFEAPLLDTGRRAWTNGLAFAPDGSVIAVGATDRMVYLLDAKTGKQLHQLVGHRNWIVIRGLVFSSDSKTLYSSGLDGNVLVWDVQSGSQVNQFSGHELGVVGLSLSADNKRLVSVSDQEGVMLVWDTAAANVTGQLQTGQGVVLSLQYSPDSEILGLTGYNGSVRLVRLQDLDSAQGFGGSARSEQSIGFLPDARIVVITSDGTIVIVDLTSGNSTTLEGLDGQPVGVVTSPNGKYVAAGSNSGSVVIWDAANGKQLQTIKTSFSAVPLLEFNYTGEILAVTGASDALQVEVWNAADGSRVSTLTGPAERITGIAFQPGGVLLAAASVDQSLRLWDAQTGTAIRTINAAAEQGWYLATAFSADGSVLAAGALNGDLQLWNVRDGSEINRFDLAGSVFSLAFSPDGKQLAASVIDGTVRILKP